MLLGVCNLTRAALQREYREGGSHTESDVIEYPAAARRMLRSVGAAGQSRRLFEWFKGPHWTLLGYHVGRDAAPPRPGLHIHTLGSRGDIVDESSYLRDASALTSGDWVLVRPDGHIGAIVSSGETGALKTYLRDAGLERGWA